MQEANGSKKGEKPRGKLTSSIGKPWKDMTKKEKLEEIRQRGKAQEDYVKGRGIWKNKDTINAGLYDVDNGAEKYLERLKKLYIELGGKK